MHTKLKLWKRVRKIRKEKNISQEQLGFKSELYRIYLSAVKGYLKNFSVEDIENIASFSKDFCEKRADKFSINLLCEKRKVREAYKEYGDISVVARLFWVTEKAMRLKFKGLFL